VACYTRSNKSFHHHIRVGNEKSDLQPIKAGVLQGSVLGLTLYTLFTSDLPTSSNTTIGTIADDIAILSVHKEPDIAASNLQHHLSALQNWFEKWHIKINADKSRYITFTRRKRPTPDVCINGTQIPRKTEIKYLGMIIHVRWVPLSPRHGVSSGCGW
jgi:hypothetical protein